MAGLVFLWSGAAAPVPPTIPTYHFRMALSADPTLWTSLDHRVMAFETRRGRDDQYSGVAAGTTQFDADDSDGAFDADNAASPFYPHVKLRRRMQAYATLPDGTDYYLGTGYLQRNNAKPLTLDADVSLQGIDLFEQLKQKRSVTAPSEAVGARIGRMLDAAGFSATDRSLDLGQLVLPAATLTDVAPLSHINNVLVAERGLFHINGQGYAVYHDRHWRLNRFPIGHFGAHGDFPIPIPQPTLDDAGLFNDIRAKRTGGVEQSAIDATSQGDYGAYNYVLATDIADLLASDEDARLWTNWLLGERKDPVNRVAYIEVDPYADADLWPIILGSDIGDAIKISHNLPGTKGLLDTTFYIEGITHKVLLRGDPIHYCKWSLSRAPQHTWWQLDDFVELETDTWLVY